MIADESGFDPSIGEESHDTGSSEVHPVNRLSTSTPSGVNIGPDSSFSFFKREAAGGSFSLRAILLKTVKIVIPNTGIFSARDVLELRPVFSCSGQRNDVHPARLVNRLKCVYPLAKMLHQVASLLSRGPIKGQPTVFEEEHLRFILLILWQLRVPLKFGVLDDMRLDRFFDVVIHNVADP